MIEWEGQIPVVASPPTVGVAWRLEELGPKFDDPERFLSDREFYERGWRWCECYSTWEPGGDRGYVPAANLLPLRPVELDAARAALMHGEDVFRRALEALLDCVTHRMN
jgi:hypothetical protein